jgi:hypothetical protein
MAYVNTVLKPLTLAAMPAMNDAMRPGITVTIGMNSFGYAAIRGVRRAAPTLRADSARCTSAKFVVR